MPIRKVTIPVAAGRNLAVLVEAAVRNFVLNQRGIDSTKEFIERQQKLMNEGSTELEPTTMDLLLIGGVSGSGKSVALAAFEDAGYYAVNNLPVPLLVETADYLRGRRPAARRRSRSTSRRGPDCPACPTRSTALAQRGWKVRFIYPRRNGRDAGQALFGDAAPPSLLERRSHADRSDRIRARPAGRRAPARHAVRHAASCLRRACAAGSRTSSRSIRRN